MEFQDVVRQRYAAKKFDGKSIPQEKMDELIELIRLTPSGLNLQPWKIKIVTDQKTKDELFPVTGEQPSVTSCSHLLVLCANTDFDDLVAKADKSMRDGGVPDEIRRHVIELASAHKEKSLEARLAYARNQVFISLGNALNGAKALGLDACPMTNFQPQEYSRILNIPAHIVPTVLVAVGYAADKPMPKRRLAKEDIVF
jgi:nitroreductase